MLTDPKEDYARGHVPFLGVKVFLDSLPLIPRTETEYWAESAIKEIPKETPVCVIDLFSGSGCIGLAVLKYRPNAFVTFADIEVSHFKTIEKSLNENNLDSGHVFLEESDVWSAIDGRFDFILANPPYVSRERNTVKESVSGHESHTALFAKEDGYACIRKTVAGLPKALASKGVCYIEHEPFHTEKITAQVGEIGFVSSTHKDQYGVERYTRIVRKPVA